MTFEILRPTALLPEDVALPAAKRLSILAAEALGFELRRRVATGLAKHPAGLVVFDWRGPAKGWAPGEPGTVWKASPPSYATDINSALDLILDANAKGYRGTLVTFDLDGVHGATMAFDFFDYPHTPPAMWTTSARAQAPSEAEAITIAYLTLARVIHPMLEEITCPTR